jgi:hypothetical protein
MTCRRCRKKFEEFETRCPHCGESNDHAAGMFQTSSVLISTSGTERVYRSVEEVPAALRTRLLKSTNGANSATILIADRRGRQEIAKAMRNLPGPAPRRWMQAILGPAATSTAMDWLTPARRRAMIVVVALFTVITIGLLFTRFH